MGANRWIGRSLQASITLTPSLNPKTILGSNFAGHFFGFELNGRPRQ